MMRTQGETQATINLPAPCDAGAEQWSWLR